MLASSSAGMLTMNLTQRSSSPARCQQGARLPSPGGRAAHNPPAASSIRESSLEYLIISCADGISVTPQLCRGTAGVLAWLGTSSDRSLLGCTATSLD